MATLWERIVGDNLDDGEQDPQQQKIALHEFWGLIDEWQRGYESQSNVLAALNLSSAQITDAQVIKQNINAIPTSDGQTTFILVCKSWSYIGEVTEASDPGTTKYHDWAQFVQRMNSEVVDQGGTPP